MATTSIDTSELEYLKSCRDKLRDIAAVLNKKEPEEKEKLKEIEKIIKNWPSIRKDEVD